MKICLSQLLSLMTDAQEGIEVNSNKKNDDEASKEAKEAALNFINQAVDAENLIVLAGSGTSLTFNEKDGPSIAPSMWDLWNFCRELDSCVFDDIKHFSGYEQLTSSPEEENIELLLSICDSHLSLKSQEENELQKIAAFLESAKKEILKRTSFISDVLEDKWQHHNQFIRTLGHRNQKQKRLKLFTTNYDQAFEAAASNTGMIVIDGFEYSNPARFNPAWFNYDIVSRSQSPDGSSFYLSNVVHLYKLHGSVDWVKNTKSGIVQKGNPIDPKENEEPVFIYPSSSKYQSSYDSPYLDMMSAFLNAVQKPKTALICVGFSFNDKHLNNAIMMALRTNPEMMLLVATKDLLEETSSFNQEIKNNLMSLIKGGDSRIMLADGLFSEFVEMLPNRNKESPEEKLAKVFEQVMAGGK